LKWAIKSPDVQRPYIEHALMVADVMVAIEITARDREDLEFVAAEQLLLLKPRPDRSHPWKLSTYLIVGRERHSVTLIPDGVFALRSRATGRCACFFLEADRGTMPIERADFTQTSIRRKLLAYQAALKARQHVERFAFHNLRILTVTTGAERLQSMIGALNAVTGGNATGRFLFAEHLVATGADPLSLLWTTNSAPARIDAPLR
jgi:Replication-relaxation